MLLAILSNVYLFCYLFWKFYNIVWHLKYVHALSLSLSLTHTHTHTYAYLTTKQKTIYFEYENDKMIEPNTLSPFWVMCYWH